MSTSWYDESEVLASTSKILSLIDAKYTSPDPQQFDLASYTMTTTTQQYPLHYQPLKPTQYTSLPPIYCDEEALDIELTTNLELYTTKVLPPDWAQDYHYTIDDFDNLSQVQALCQYIFVLDSLNFCFWPFQGYEYEHLACSLKDALVNHPDAFSATNLMKMDDVTLVKYLQPPSHLPLIKTTFNNQPQLQKDVINNLYPIPLLHSRVRLLRQLGAVLNQHFDGLAYNLILQANKSAKTLVRLITQYLPGFCDHSQFYNDQIFFYKRVQILVGDLWGAMHDKVDVITFTDMNFLTCFPDYRIPQLFRSIGILKCNPAFESILNDTTTNQQNCLPNSEEEILIRSWTVQCVELIKKKLLQKGVEIQAFQLDWLLWERGEKLMKLNQILPHHRTLTTYY